MAVVAVSPGHHFSGRAPGAMVWDPVGPRVAASAADVARSQLDAFGTRSMPSTPYKSYTGPSLSQRGSMTLAPRTFKSQNPRLSPPTSAGGHAAATSTPPRPTLVLPKGAVEPAGAQSRASDTRLCAGNNGCAGEPTERQVSLGSAAARQCSPATTVGSPGPVMGRSRTLPNKSPPRARNDATRTCAGTASLRTVRFDVPASSPKRSQLKPLPRLPPSSGTECGFVTEEELEDDDADTPPMMHTRSLDSGLAMKRAKLAPQRLLESRPPAVTVRVVAPGAGTGANHEAYAQLSQRPGINLEVKGQARAAYDRYPLGWANGCAAPNLESFAGDLLAQGAIEDCSCLVFGSRGGQVVLPALWRARGAEVPPAVVINGGVAMRQLPSPVPWPDAAVTFLLLGGQDYFRSDLTTQQYLADARKRVPRRNSTTAILFVNEMGHMPQAKLMSGLLHHMVAAIVGWRGSSGGAPRAEFDAILAELVRLGFSGCLMYTSDVEAWEEFAFDKQGSRRL